MAELIVPLFSQHCAALSPPIALPLPEMEKTMKCYDTQRRSERTRTVAQKVASRLHWSGSATLTNRTTPGRVKPKLLFNNHVTSLPD